MLPTSKNPRERTHTLQSACVLCHTGLLCGRPEADVQRDVIGLAMVAPRCSLHIVVSVLIAGSSHRRRGVQGLRCPVDFQRVHLRTPLFDGCNPRVDWRSVRKTYDLAVAADQAVCDETTPGRSSPYVSEDDRVTVIGASLGQSSSAAVC